MSAGTKATPVLDKTFTSDVTVTVGQVVVASTANRGNVKLGAAGGLAIVGSVISVDSQNVCTVRLYGIAQCKTLTGTAIHVGDRVKIADSNGRVTLFTNAAAGAGTKKGIVGTSLSEIASGDASDTLCDVLLAIGEQDFE